MSSNTVRETPANSIRVWQQLLMQYGGMALALVVLIAVFSLRSKTFFSAATFTTIANSIPDLTIVAVGMTFVLIVGGIDLSVGSVLALASSVFAILLTDWHWPIGGAALIAILCAGICGLLNGFVSAQYRIPAFIVTLGMLEIARGGAYLITNSETKYVGSTIEWATAPIANLAVSPAFLFAVLVVLAGQWMLHRTVLGRMAVAIGTNAETVRMSGIRTLPALLSIYTLCGVLCGVAALIQTSRLSTADPNSGAGLELAAIAACVIGGTSLRGGSGSVINTFFGVLIVSVLQSGLAQMGASDPMKRIVTGMVIIFAVLIDSLRSRQR
ncbi:MAG: ABC transporter permease [Pirellula sp.]